MPTRPLLLAASLLAALPALAHDYRLGDLAILHPTITATAPNAPVAGAHMTIANEGAQDDVLLAVAVEPGVAGAAEIHEMAMEDGIMRMGEVAGGIPVPAGATVTLEPGGLHVMLTRLPAGLEAGQEIPATLTFERAGEVEVVFQVEARGLGGHGEGRAAHGR